MIKNTTKGFERIYRAVFILTAIVSFTPILSGSLLLLMVVTLTAMLITKYLGSVNYRKNGRLVACVFAYILVCLIYKVLGVSSVPPGGLVVQILFFTAILLMLLPVGVVAEKYYRRLFWITAIIAVINMVDNIRLCLIYPEVMLLVRRDASDMATGMNFGGFNFFTAVLFFFTVCLFGYFNCKYKKYKIILLGLIVLSLVFIFGFCFKAGIIVYTILSFFLLFFARKARKASTFLVRISIPVVLVFALVNVYSDFFVEQIVKVFDNPRLAQRLMVLVDADNAAAETGTVEARQNLWLLSIETWLKEPINFFVGIGDHRVNWDEGQTARQVGLGNHSDFFDTPARYGLIGIFLIASIITMSCKYLLSIFERKYKIQVLVIILIFIMFGFTYGGFKPAIGFILFLLLPAMKYIIGDKSHDNQIK